MRISLNCLNETCYSTPQPGPYHHPHHHHPHQFFMQPQQGLWPHVQSHNMVSNLVFWVFFVLLSASVLWVFYHLCPWERWKNEHLGFTVQRWVKITQSWCIIWIEFRYESFKSKFSLIHLAFNFLFDVLKVLVKIIHEYTFEQKKVTRLTFNPGLALITNQSVNNQTLGWVAQFGLR